MTQTELKARYNKTLKRVRLGEKYYEINKFDVHYQKFVGMIHELNVILRYIESATSDEILEGFNE